jgi:methylglutaconyl-CoA hydratase
MDTIQLTISDTVAFIRMNRPENHNALNPQVIQGFIQALQNAHAEPNVRIICIQGSGKHFCAGADLQWLQASMRYNEMDNIADAKQLSTLLNTLYDSPKITVAYVQGKALGGGLGIISHCDMVIADPQAQFAAPETTIGMVPAIIAPAVCAKIGIEKARLLFLSAIHVSAKTAVNWGLVTETIESADFATHLDMLQTQIKKTAPGAVATTKQILRDIAKDRYSDSHLLMAKTRTNKEAQEGFQCFFTNTVPHWQS